jgi:methionine-rich copper-binding protein CopC
MRITNTINNIGPVLIYSDPFDGATAFKFDQAITLNFNEIVAAGSGDIIISNGSDTRTIDVNDSSQVTFDLEKVTINPSTGLIPDTTYNIQMTSGVIVDATGNSFVGIDDTTTLNFTTISDSDPLLIESNPYNGFARFQADSNITLAFDENVSAGNGNIIISNGSDTHTIAIGDSSQVIFEGNTVTINPATDLTADTLYSVQIANGAIVDTVGNPYAGINEANALIFRTTFPSDPRLEYSFPSNGDTEFQIDRNIELNFDENVVAGSGDILISNGTDTRTIAIDDTSQVTFRRDRVTIDPAEDLLGDTTYSVQIPNGAITDEAGNVFASISDTTFATITSDPRLNFSNIENNPGFKIDNDIELFFDRTVTAGNGNIILTNGTDTHTIAIDDTSQVTFDLDRVIINPTTDLVANSTYNIEIDNGVIMDTAGHNFAGISDTTFTTVASNPLLSFSSINDNSAFIIDDDITLYFDEIVTAGSGDIVISNGIDTHTIAVDDASQVAFESDTVIINPTGELVENTTYNIQIGNGVIKDIAGNPFAGINNAAFTTTNSDPQLVSSNPENKSLLKVDDNIELLFNEMVTAGSGNIIISNGSDTRTIAINDSNQIAFDKEPFPTFISDFGISPRLSHFDAGFNDFGRNPNFYPDYGAVSIDPLADLAVNTTYSVQIASGVITDNAGHGYQGLNDFTFTTVASNPLLIYSNPTNNASLKIDEDITLFFDETVTAGKGNIVLSNGSDTRTIAIDDASQVGFNFGYITINPTEDLITNTIYNVQIDNGVIEDTAGNAFAGINDAAISTISAAPLIIYSNPTNDSTFIIDDDITLYFDEVVTAGSGDIIISNGTDTRTIAINDTRQVSFGFESITINPTEDLVANTTYNFQIGNGTIIDTAGNAFAGIDDASFTTIDSNPTLISSNPENKSSIKTDGDIRLNFDEEVIAGSGNIIISSGSDTRTIAINDINQVTFGKEGFDYGVTINPTDDLIPNTSYSVQLASGAITDKAGHAYAGFDDVTITATNSDPLLISSNPINNSIFKSDGNIELHFDEAVAASGGNIIISNGDDNRAIAIDDTSQVTFIDNIVIINPTTDLVADATYSFQMESGVITDTAGNAYGGIDGATFITTADPLLTASFPSNDSIFEINGDIELYFDEVVVAGNGDIVISNGSDTRKIAIDDTSQVAFQTITGIPFTNTVQTISSQNTIFSAIIINPTEDLIPDTTYSIQIDNSAIEDTDGHAYAGIEDAASLNFTAIEPFTIDSPFPIIL